MSELRAGVPQSRTYLHQHQLLDRCVLGGWRAESLDSLRRYFQQDGPATALSGRHLDRFAGGGDARDVRNVVTASDVLALTFLSIKDRLGAFAIDVLEGHAEEIGRLLRALPGDLADFRGESRPQLGTSFGPTSQSGQLIL